VTLYFVGCSGSNEGDPVQSFFRTFEAYYKQSKEHMPDYGYFLNKARPLKNLKEIDKLLKMDSKVRKTRKRLFKYWLKIRKTIIWDDSINNSLTRDKRKELIVFFIMYNEYFTSTKAYLENKAYTTMSVTTAYNYFFSKKDINAIVKKHAVHTARYLSNVEMELRRRNFIILNYWPRIKKILKGLY